jgi:hypothetical protein
MRQHKRASAVVLAIIALLVLLSVIAVVAGSSNAALSDGTSCSQWDSSSPKQQEAYSRLYLKEHGAIGAAKQPASVRSAIADACSQSALLGESDDVSVLAAVKGYF